MIMFVTKGPILVSEMNIMILRAHVAGLVIAVGGLAVLMMIDAAITLVLTSTTRHHQTVR